MRRRGDEEIANRKSPCLLVTLSLSSPHLPPECPRAEVEALAKRFAEVVGIGEAGRLGDALNCLVGVEETACRLLHADLLDKMGWPKTCSRFECVAEMAPAHAVECGEFANCNWAFKRTKHVTPHFIKQPFALALGLVAAPGCPLVFPEELEQRTLMSNRIMGRGAADMGK